MPYWLWKHGPGKKKYNLSDWLYTKLPEWVNWRILTLDADSFIECGRIYAKAKRTIPVVDSLIAAAAIAHHMTLFTVNTGDFDNIKGMMLINP